jgi:N-6 DNA Methylase
VEELHRGAPEALQRERVTRLVLERVVARFAEDTGLTPPRVLTAAMAEADDLAPDQIHAVHAAIAGIDWQDVRPEIFGSIFEQALGLTARHGLGAHFTREADIVRVVGPTVIDPWRERIATSRGGPEAVEALVGRMRSFHVLDPACGCGNFLSVVYREMKRLEAALFRRADGKPPPPLPYFSLHQIHGIEKNATAAFLSRVVLWIGDHLARREIGLLEEASPVEPPGADILHADALEVPWLRPEGELAIVGNPPFLGVRKMRHELGDAYVERLFSLYPRNRAADYVTYWFTRAVDTLREGERAGYVATNSISQNESRAASLDPIVARGGTITHAWKSYPWPGEAVVHVGIVNWVMAPHAGARFLDGEEVPSISPGLTRTADVTGARAIPGNLGLCFMGVTPGNHGFILTADQRAEILAEDPGSARVIKRFLVGRDVNREIDQAPTRWIIDFGTMTQAEAEQARGAMRHVREHVHPVRSQSRRGSRARSWWRFAEPAPGLRRAIEAMRDVLVMPCVSPHLVVSRQRGETCFDHQLMVVALAGAYDLGVLQSRLHQTWARARGSTLKGDLRYTNTTIFDAFPFPLHPGGAYDPRAVPDTGEARRAAEAAEAFDRLRAATCQERGLGLTKIHNALTAGALPALGEAYDALNDAVTACYGFPEGTWRSERDTLRLLLSLNQELTSGDAG